MRLSVVVPARDAEATLPRTLDALARQDVDEDYEVILVDDGSTDGTASIGERAGVVVLRQERLGPDAARNDVESRRDVAACEPEVRSACGSHKCELPTVSTGSGE